jgi:hypothetical protein
MVITPFRSIDTFSRTNASALGSADSGEAWSSSVPLQSVGNGYALLRASANMSRKYVRLQSTAARDSEVLMRFSYEGTMSSPLTDFGPIINGTSANTNYMLAIQANYGELAIQVSINGVRSEIVRRSFGLVKNTHYWARFKRDSAGVYGRIWVDGTAEPTSWTITSPLWNASGAPSTGSGGVYIQGTRDAYDLKLHTFYYFTTTDTTPTSYPWDTFNRDVTSEGFGRALTGHLWEGAVSDDPEYYGLRRQGSTNATLAPVVLNSTVPTYGSIGAVRGGDLELFARVSFNSVAAGTFYLGIRGQKLKSSNQLKMAGYAVKLDATSSTFTIVKRTTALGSWISLGSYVLGFSFAAATEYAVRFQIVGTTLNARVYPFLGTEPTTWQISVVDAGFASGTYWFGIDQNDSTSRTYNIHDFMGKEPTRDVGVTKNFVTTGAVTTTDLSDTSIGLSATFTDDENNNNTISIRYRPTTETTWTNFVGTITPNYTTNVHTATITGVIPATAYTIEVTYNDVDGEEGPNPVVVSHTTGQRGVVGEGITITSTTTNQIGVSATYSRDSDNDSTAILEVRESSYNNNYIEDYFVDEDEGEFLQNITSSAGGTWNKHPTMTAAVNAILSNRMFYVNTVSVNDKALYIHSLSSPTAEYHAHAALRGDQLLGRTGVAVRMNATTETYYGFGINAATNKWEYFKMSSGTKTVLQSYTFSGDLDQIYDVEVLVQATQRRLYVNGILLGVDSNNDLPETYRVGYFSQAIPNGSPENQFKLLWYKAHYRTTVGSWVSQGAMTVDRGTKTFTKTATGLNQDTVYELRVTFTDADGVTGSTFATTAQTTGSAVELSSMGATTYATSAIIDVFYNYDINNNSTLEIQYKATTDHLWTTIAYNRVKADRVARKFSTTITGIRPSQTYEVRAEISDPDGLMETSPTFLSGLFTTKGATIEDKTQSLHYLWKVYDRKGVYLGTIADAPDPEFSIHENGGVTDLSFELPRKMSETHSEKIIAFQNTVDIWALDPSSNGMGPNLIADPDCDPTVGAWVVSGDTYGQNSDYSLTGGPDGSSCIQITATETQYETSSNPIETGGGLPLVVTCAARAVGAKLRMYVRAYDVNDVALDSSEEIAETVGTGWQQLRVEYLPPTGTAYLRVLIRNTGRGTMWADKFSVLTKEMLIYRGRIEAFTPKIDENGETVSVEVLGLSSLLSDDYIEFLQFVEIQPQDDVLAGRINNGAKDPADMMKMIIDEARRVNPMFNLYYTNESIRFTGNLMQYTFKDQQIRSCMDKVRNLCPAGWHYYIEPDGLVVLRGAEHAPTHTLRMGREVTRFEVEKSIRNLKNYIRVKGRQDEDMSEGDGYGSINYITFDQQSIDKYGKRVLFVRDAQLVDPESAKIVGDGRLDENNRQEQRASCYIPDEKLNVISNGLLTGYNVQSLRAGDNILVIDPIAGPRNTYWDQFEWDNDQWDVRDVFTPLEESVPIKTVRVYGDRVELELSQRPPSSVGDFSKFYRWMANKDMED